MHYAIQRGTRQAGRDALLIKTILPVIGLVLTLALTPLPASAGVILGAEVRISYEDNVVGPLSDKQSGAGGGMTGSGGGTMMQAPGMGGMGGSQTQYTGSGSQSSGDFSGTVSAEAGGYTNIGVDSALFAKGFAQHTAYNNFTDLNSTIAGVSTGANVIMSDGLSGRLELYGKLKHYGDTSRNSNAYGAAVNFNQKPLPSLLLRERAEYEDNRADSSSFTYTGTAAGITAGYEVTETLVLTAGYRYLVQDFSTLGSKLTTDTTSLGFEKKLSREWSVGGEYDLQISKPDGGASTRDNIFSLALQYAY